MEPPGPPIPAAASTLFWMRAPLRYMEVLSKRYGEPFTMKLAGFPRLVVTSEPSVIKEVFSDDGTTFAAGAFNRSLAALLGDRSVLMLDGREHLRQRRLLLPPLHGERMQRYGRIMRDATDAAIDAWREGDVFSVHPYTQAITLEAIVRTVFGVEKEERVREMMARMKRILHLGSWAPLLIPAVQRDLGRYSPWGKFRRAVEHGDRFIYEDIQSRRASGERGEDVLSLLLDAKDEEGKPLTDLELRDEMVTLLVAGHETTATGLAWALRWALATPGLVERARAEPALVDAIAREAMRLNPVIPIVGRILLKDVTLSGHLLPAGTPLALSIYLAHRREEAWPDAKQFRPDRFLEKKILPNEFLPFGGGIRRCIGMAFALYEMRVVLARILERCDLELAPKGPIKAVRRSITLMPTDGLRVRLLRKRAATIH